MSIAALARPAIQALHAYQAAAQVDDTIRLNANELPGNATGSRFRRPLNRYPEVRPRRLQSALASHYACGAEQVLVTRGSSEAIDLVVRTFCESGTHNVVVPSPSFSMYGHYAAVQGAQLIDVPMNADEDFRMDVDALLRASNQDTRVVFLCSPNNPTGTALPRADILRLVAGLDGKAAVVVDEAYIEFGSQPSMIEVLDDYPNLLVLRTLSKALGFAGARCGVVAGSADVISLLNAVQAPYALATPVVECVEDVLESDQLERMQATIADVIAERSRMMRALERYPFVRKVWPSEANFFLARFSNAEAIMTKCANDGILLRHFGGNLNDCVRITIGSRSDNDRLLASLEALTDDSHGA